jgi:protein-disulfide isomerase
MSFKNLAIQMSMVTFLLMSCQQSKSPEPAVGPGETMRPEIQALQQQLAEQKRLLEEIKSDVEGIKKAIEVAQRPPSPSEDQQRQVSIDDDYIRGRPNAKLTLVEFSDFQCPFCERFYRETLPLIDKEYIQTGKVRMVYRDFPLENIHKDAMKAAEAAQCAGEQGEYWKMHDKIFENQKAMGMEDLKKYARELGLSGERFDECLDSGKYSEEVLKDFRDGQVLGVQGTPTFFVGHSEKGKMIQGIPIRGARPYIVFKQAFDKLLQEK